MDRKTLSSISCYSAPWTVWKSVGAVPVSHSLLARLEKSWPLELRTGVNRRKLHLPCSFADDCFITFVLFFKNPSLEPCCHSTYLLLLAAGMTEAAIYPAFQLGQPRYDQVGLQRVGRVSVLFRAKYSSVCQSRWAVMNNNNNIFVCIHHHHHFIKSWRFVFSWGIAWLSTQRALWRIKYQISSVWLEFANKHTLCYLFIQVVHSWFVCLSFISVKHKCKGWSHKFIFILSYLASLFTHAWSAYKKGGNCSCFFFFLPFFPFFLLLPLILVYEIWVTSVRRMQSNGLSSAFSLSQASFIIRASPRSDGWMDGWMDGCLFKTLGILHGNTTVTSY